MKTSQSTKEWASVGAGALISGALIVVVAQLAIVRKGTEGPGNGDPGPTAAALAQDPGSPERVDPQRPRLQLPQRSEEEAGSESTDSARRVAPVQSSTGKVALGGKERVAGAVQRLAEARSTGKATRADVTPELTSTIARNEPVQAPMTSIHPKFRTASTTVNAAFEAPDARTAGEEFSWEVHETFQSDGPRPFFYVDENTGTLMFGLGWQH